MIYAYKLSETGLAPVPMPASDLPEEPAAPLSLPPEVIWIDLYRPVPEQIEAVEALGITVPTLADMEEIEISNRLYHDGNAAVMTVVLPGKGASGEQTTGPVCFILSPELLVTVRHHAPRPFETYPSRASQGLAGCSTPQQAFLGLAEEITSRLADLLEGAGKVLDETARVVFGGGAAGQAALLQSTLEQVGRQGEVLGRVRLAVMTLERALSFYGTTKRGKTVEALLKGEMRDLHSLSVHADFLSTRVGLTVDATLGMINLAQNATVRIVSVVAVLFLPPTLVASAYGMNFQGMPGLHQPWGYSLAVGLMVASALGTWLVFRWRRWL